MRLCVERPRVAVTTFVGVEPGLRMECLGLEISAQLNYTMLGCIYLLHIVEELLAAPALQFPVIIVLLATTNTQGAIAPTASAQESTPTEFDLAIVDAGHGRSDEVPVCLGIEVVRPTFCVSRGLRRPGRGDIPPSHMDIF